MNENLAWMTYGRQVNNRDRYGQNPLATREMYAVRNTRPMKDIVRSAVAKLFAARS